MLLQLRRRVARRLPSPVLAAGLRVLHGAHPVQRGAARRRSLLRGPAPAGHSPDPVGPLYPRLVDTFDAHADRRAVADTVAAALDAAGVGFARVPVRSGERYLIAVAAEDRAQALAGLAQRVAGPEWGVTRYTPGRAEGRLVRGTVRATAAASRDSAAQLLVFHAVTAAGAEGLLAGTGSGCLLQFWPRVGRAGVERKDGGAFEPATRLAPPGGPVAYLSPDTWAAAVASVDHWPTATPAPSMFDVRFPIDIVYTWVDGADPQWLARKAAFAAGGVADGNAGDGADPDLTLNPSAVHESRFVSRDELRYSLRSVAMYANWVRRIFIVTDRQVPAWLNTADPRIRVVDHSEIFTDPSALPVFNSHAIESQLHHIPDLAEHYLYLNDDMIFGRPVDPELFFLGNGLARFFLSTGRLDLDPPSARDLPVQSAAKVNRALLERRFGASVGHKFLHAPYPQLRSVLEQLERDEPELFDRVARSRFRHPDDASVPSALSHYYAYALGRAVPGRIAYSYQDIAAPGSAQRLLNLLLTRRTDAFCVNDHETPPERHRAIAAELDDFLTHYFPLPGPFEVPG